MHNYYHALYVDMTKFVFDMNYFILFLYKRQKLAADASAGQIAAIPTTAPRVVQQILHRNQVATIMWRPVLLQMPYDHQATMVCQQWLVRQALNHMYHQIVGLYWLVHLPTIMKATDSHYVK